MTTRSGDRLVAGALPVLGVVVAFALAACATSPAPAFASASPSGATATPFRTLATSAPSATPAPSRPSAQPSVAPSASASTDPLVGTWTTGPVTCDQWNGAIAKAYTPAQIATYANDPNTHQCPATFTIRFRGQHLVIFVGDEAGWDGLYRLKGANEIEAGDNCAYCWLYRYRLSGGKLTIDLVKDGDAIDRVLDGIVQTGIYESAVFERVG